MNEPVVLADRQGHVTILTINRPEVRNAIDQQTWIALGEMLEAADHDDDVRAIVLTATGEESFCAGADLKAISRGERVPPEDPRQLGWGFAGIVSHVISTPLIAAVNGSALGGGTEIVLACDLAIAAPKAMFGLPEVKRGLLAGGGGCFRLLQNLPPKMAMEMILTGKSIDAGQAQERGLINGVVSSEKLLQSALDLAGEIAANAPLAVQGSKRVARGIIDGVVPGETASWALTKKESASVMASIDAREGALAFVERRKPVWTSR